MHKLISLIEILYFFPKIIIVIYIKGKKYVMFELDLSNQIISKIKACVTLSVFIKKIAQGTIILYKLTELRC